MINYIGRGRILQKKGSFLCTMYNMSVDIIKTVEKLSCESGNQFELLFRLVLRCTNDSKFTAACFRQYFVAISQ